jgi:DNA-binding NtrC family response regulator
MTKILLIDDDENLRVTLKIAVAMSGGGRTGNIRFLDMAMELGASQTLAKPFAMKALVDCVRELTNGA